MAESDPASNAEGNQASNAESKKAWRGEWTGFVVRSCKYLVLLLALLFVLYVVFDGYSFYVARRSIDSELESKKISSLEYLNVLAQRDRALVIATLETRCLERTELALFRIFEAQFEAELQAAYADLRSVKDDLVDTLKRLGPGAVNVGAATNYVNSATFTVLDFERHLEPVPGATRDDEKYKKLREEIDQELRDYAAKGQKYLSLRKRAVEEVKDHPAKGQLSLESIRVLEERLSRLKEEREKNKERLGDLDDVMSRYAVWTGALSGGLAESPVLDEMAYDIGLEGDKALATVKCDRFKEYYQAVEQKLIRADPARGKISEGLSMWQQINNLPLVYRQFLVNYFKQPPAAQTLFVTLALGALGALTLNVLRLSKVGWWAQYKDPLWGEIMVSPLLGALADLEFI